MQYSLKNNNPLLIIVGMCGAGKSSITNYLKRKGWQVIHFGEIIMRELNVRKLPINENNERAIREELRRKHGPNTFAKLLLRKIKKALMINPTVIDGLYSWTEYKFLKQKIKNPIFVVAVYTTRYIRYKRLASRPFRPLVPKEAEMRDFAEIENLEKGGPIALADYIILNDGSEEELYNAIDKFLSLYIKNIYRIIRK